MVVAHIPSKAVSLIFDFTFNISKNSEVLHMTLQLKLSPGLVQKPILDHRLILTPRLQQAIKLVQLSRFELIETVGQEMEENPVLEELVTGEAEENSYVHDESEEGSSDLPEVTVEEHANKDVDWDNYLSEYNTGWAETAYEPKDTPTCESTTFTKINLSSHLMWQLNMTNPGEEQREIAAYIIGNLDEDGYLDIQLEEIFQTFRCSVEKVLEALHFVQHFDPVGVAARDMRECLLIQARFQNFEGTIVEKIIMDHLGDLENRKFDTIAKRLSVPIEQVISAVTIIQGLEPKPGRGYSDDETIYVTPDIYIFKVGDDYEIVQNEDGLPKLRISAYYKSILRSKDALSDSARTYIREKLESAAWLIKSIHHRKRTIYRVTESIIRFQKDFLDNGITQLKPLVLRDVAEEIKMHESTVSRATTNKYVHTPQGLIELKFFFSGSVNKIDGGAVSSESVKEHIRNIIKSENVLDPYSDQEIEGILKRLNIRLARRTVAKYRESMGILPSGRRKKDKFELIS